MGIADDAVEIRAQGWRTLAALHGLIESSLERELTGAHDLSVVEFTVLDALSRQDGWHMRMSQLARAAALSNSATTRLVNRLEDRKLIRRILCADDRRGIYTELTAAGVKLLDAAGNELNMQFDFLSMQNLYLSLAREDARPLARSTSRLALQKPGSSSISGSSTMR